MSRGRQELGATLARAHEAWQRRWENDGMPLLRYRVSFWCDARAFREIVDISMSAPVSSFTARYDCRGDPQAVIGFDCPYETWEVLRKSFESVPATKRSFRQEELPEGGD